MREEFALRNRGYEPIYPSDKVGNWILNISIALLCAGAILTLAVWAIKAVIYLNTNTYINTYLNKYLGG
jgi:hypothetical protein